MKFPRISTLFCASFLLGALSVPLLAQDQAQEPPPPKGLGPRINAQQGQPAPGQAPAGPPVETIATFNGWNVQCSEIPAQGDNPGFKACGMARSAASAKEQKIGISLVIKRIKNQEGKKMTVMDAFAPIGVYLPTGVAMEIDGTALEGRMSFTRCLPSACNAFGEASEATLKKFLKGKAVTFYIYDRPGNGYPIKFPLQGFSEGLAQLDKLMPK